MASLGSHRVCHTAEVLQTSQDKNQFAHRSKKRKTLSWQMGTWRMGTWQMGTWNVRSMVDTEGPIEVASRCGQRGEDRKVDLIEMELKRYDMKVAALQETKWFGSEVYQVGGSVVLTAGRERPSEGDDMQRGEGVAIVLLGPAIDAWKRTGKQWKAWGPRAVSACLQVGERIKTKLHMVLYYAPTRAASRQVKDAFYQDLESILPAIPTGEKYVILGDFNAPVGSRECVGDWWGSVRGPHGNGVINDACKEFLSFLSVHRATVCNTWFVKKATHQQTWQHPKSKQWSCINYVIMSQSDRRMCLDVAVKREVDEDLGSIPTAREVNRALGKLKNGKAPGSSNVLPGMLKVAMKGGEFGQMVLDLVKAVWKNKHVPQEWVDAILIPIPRKGNLHCFDNWRGIALLDVMGKVVAKVIQGRLQKLAERLLPECQCGFRRGRGCTDMVFTV